MLHPHIDQANQDDEGRTGDRERLLRGPGSTDQSPCVLEPFDPISLKEPPGMHDWDWLGMPKRWLRYLLHKAVLEVRER